MKNSTAWLLVVLMMGAYLLRVAGPLMSRSQTVDEPYHIGSAVALWEAKAHVIGVQHPPLPRLIAAIPLICMGAELPEYRGTTMSRKEDAAFEAGDKVLCSGDKARYFRLLTAARWAMTVFPLGAIVYAFLLGRHFAGMSAGLWSALLVSADPTLLGHGFWVCTDAAAVAGFFGVVYHAIRMVERPGWGRVVAAGLAIGLGISCKFSVLFLLPVLLGVYAVQRYRGGGRVGWRKWGVVIVTGFVALWATYFFRIGTVGDSDTLASAPQWARIPAAVKNVPVPMPAFLIGLGRLAGHSAQGHGTEMFGRVSDRGWWYYFPVLLLTKLPCVMLAVMGMGVWRAAREKRGRWEGAWGWVVIPAGVFLAVSMGGSIQIGIRHIAPAISLLLVAGGMALARQRSWGLGVIVMVLLAAESFPLGGEYIAYYNVAARRWASEIAVGSNYDWGQDLIDLTSPQYAGIAIYPLGDRQAALFETLGLSASQLDGPVSAGGRFAVSLSRKLLGSKTFPKLDQANYVGQVGNGFAIYERAGNTESDARR